MYEAALWAMDAAVCLFWGWCLYRFCGSFLILRPLFSRGKRRRGGIEERAGEEPSGGGKSFLGNGWPIWCFWTVWKWLHSLSAGTDYDSVRMLLRTALLYGALFLFLYVFYVGGRGALLFCFVTFMSVCEIGRFLAQSVLPLGNRFYDIVDQMLMEGRITDLEVYMRFVKGYSWVMQILMNGVFLGLVRGSLYLLDRTFRGRSRGFDRAELRFLLLPGCIAALFCVLLRIIMVTVEGEIPMLMYDTYPLLKGVVPLLLILCLLSVLYGARLLCELRDLHEERNRALILGQQLESMESHLKETERIYAGVRAMKHDMKNQLAVVVELAGHSGEQEELQAYLAQMNRTLSKLDFPCKTGSAALDTLLAIKFHEMREKIPDVIFEAEKLLIPSSLRVRPMDLSLILGNGLDNAIEACERLAGREQPWIRVEAMQKGPCFLLEIANSFDGRINCAEGQEFPETMKEESDLHGIGLQSIRSVALRYQGGVDWKAEGKIFTLTVMLKRQEGG